MDQIENKIIAAAFTQYSEHIASGKLGPFELDPKLGEEISSLSRSLEQKRQIATLTETETFWLRQIDDFTAKTMKYNAQPEGDKQAQTNTSVYDLEQRMQLEETDSSSPAPEPNVSGDMAEDIISQIDKQFEQKVMQRVRQERQKPSEPVESEDEPTDSSVASLGGSDGGKELQDYLTAIKAERPAVPFADRDSHIDLSQLVKNRNNGKSGTQN